MYKETKAPCYGCTKRDQWCHGNCPEYTAWSNERRQFLEERRKLKEAERSVDAELIERYNKIRRKKNKRKRHRIR